MNRLEIIQGESIDWDFQYADDEGTPIDITNYLICISAKKAQGRAMLFIKRLNDGITITDGINGKLNLLIIDTTKFKPGEYIVEASYIHPSGAVRKPFQIDLLIIEGVHNESCICG